MRLIEELDYVEINEWRKSRGAKVIPRSLYPPTGLIEPGVSAGWINFTETKMALMENFVTNPQANKQEREKSIMQIIEALEKIAYDKGIKWVLGVTSHPRIERYIYKSGGERIPCKVFGKELVWE